ncbi:MAG: glycosyltransferase, partial [Spirochaetaceae bacterium]
MRLSPMRPVFLIYMSKYSLTHSGFGVFQEKRLTKRIVHFTLITLDLYLAVTTLLCFYFLALALRNRKTLRMFTYAPDLRRTPRVSIIIPARNEENNIRACLDSLIAQEYPDYEILVIDDNSSDATYKIIKQYESSHSIIRAFRGKPLPPDWVGKQYACQQLIPEASGEYLVFTDADTVHTPLSLSWAVTNMVNHDADFMSAYLHHVIGSLGEAFVVPAIYIMTTLLMPLWKIPEKNNSFFTFAIGQFMICRREALLAVGGYNSFKNSVVEDMSMAHAMKERGYKTIFIDGKNYVSCRMYRSFRGAFRGFAKSMYGALHQNLLLLLGLFIIVGAVIEMPVLILCHKLYSGSDDILLSILPVSTFCGLWFIVLLDRKISVIVALSYPILFLVVMLIALTSTLKTGFLQGVEWKGRKVRCHRGLEEQKKETLQEPRRINGKNIYPITT